QPVRAPGGHLVGMVAMGLDLAHWVSFSPAADELRGTIHDIVTADGVIIARSEEPEAWIGRSARASEVHRRMLEMKEGTVRALGTEGADRVWGFTPVAGTDWYARSSVSASKVLGPVKERAIDTAYVLAAVLAAVFLAVVASAARLARPMRTIASAVRTRTEGHGEVRVPVAGPREVAELATELNRMIETSERREEDLRRFRAAMDLSGDAIVLVERRTLRYIDVNRTFCEMVGYTREELLAMAPMDLFSFDRQTLERDYDALIADNRSAASLVEGSYRRKDGSLVPVESRRRALRTEGGWVIVGTSRDITERKAADAGRRQAEAELRAAHDELARSNKELEQFAYVVSHDLQEPLRMVSNYTQLLRKRYGERLEASAHEFMDFVIDGAARMKQLIEDLLAYSRVGTKGKEFKPVSIEGPLKKAITNLRAAIEESSAAVTWDPLPTLGVDEMQLAQLFQNLMGNALKFRAPGVPRIHVSAEDKDGAWHITVADNGIGIEPQYFERIFMLFQRLHTMGEYPGTGIGLAICKKVGERHGGRIWVSSTPGEGSQFHFTLPKRDFP
ncbi:MAG TPA: ATP-binding protein, partial [Burkholderiales bacterium]|nr:ATP-binding protein [Burkholderiales bacterium]